MQLGFASNWLGPIYSARRMGKTAFQKHNLDRRGSLSYPITAAINRNSVSPLFAIERQSSPGSSEACRESFFRMNLPAEPHRRPRFWNCDGAPGLCRLRTHTEYYVFDIVTLCPMAPEKSGLLTIPTPWFPPVGWPGSPRTSERKLGIIRLIDGDLCVVK